MKALSIHAMPPAQRAAELQDARRAGMGRRIYDVCVTHADGRVVHGEGALLSDMRLAQLVRWVYRRTFGRAPADVWHCSGWMAEAWDSAGCRVSVDQVNDR